ncbi:putative SIT1-Transporter of the bacterial siderophore ferrioxamine B [Fusarium austroafricanum]|uniref:Putative SIT1-Transporter of the bacterial siderophore ferrioxamine B n=1 Tax=Fusarium austroafricanum TaxID=2364996 RepID=A0A8H4NYG9_9HYPO|nr:putative SIT1-Transporter of the bacterial siderophore ferrioxamine B [Fusarium austroafricanum]
MATKTDITAEIDQKDAPDPPAPLRHGRSLRGVLRMEAAAGKLTTAKRWIFFTSIFLFGYVLNLDYLTRNAYVPYATSSFGNHSLLATVNVIREVVTAAIQPSVARLTDVFGRIEIFTIAVLLSLTGTIIQTYSANIQSFAGGAVLYSIGYKTSILVIEIMIADFTSMKTRLFFAFVPNWPSIVNTWISGDVTSAVLSVTSWKWGIGMFAIVNPVCALPLIILMFILGRQKNLVNREQEPTSVARSLKSFFWELDVIGVLLLTAALAMTLAPLTLAGGQSSKWQDAGILTPLIIGFLLFPAFVIWEKSSSHPMFPIHLLKHRTVWGCLGISCIFPCAFMIIGNYLFSLLVISYNFAIKDATRVALLFQFCAVLVGSLLGPLVIKLRRLKELILSGIVLWLVGFGLIYHYRGGSGSKSGVIGAEVVLGIGGGLFSWPALVLIQTAAQHEYIGVLISLVFTANSVGQALGNCISGAIWTQTLFSQLEKNLGPFGNDTLASAVYASPLTVVPEYAIGSPERDAIVLSYRYIQRNLTIAAMCLAVPMLILGLCLHNPILSDQQVQMDEIQRPEVKEDKSESQA